MYVPFSVHCMRRQGNCNIDFEHQMTVLHQGCILRGDDQSTRFLLTSYYAGWWSMTWQGYLCYYSRCNVASSFLKCFPKKRGFVKAKTMIVTTQQRFIVGITTKQIPQWELVNNYSDPSHAHSGNSTTPSRVTCHTPCADAFARSDWLPSAAEHLQRVVVYPSAQTF